MISKSETIERMNSCDARLEQRIELAIERAIIEAADLKRSFVSYHFPGIYPDIQNRLTLKLGQLGYEVKTTLNIITVGW